MNDVSPPASGHAAEQPDDTACLQAAKQLRSDYPAWVVIWVARQGQFCAYPLFRTRRAIAVSAARPADLAAQMDEIQRAARAPRAVPPPASTAG